MAFELWLKRRMAEHDGVGVKPEELARAVDVHPSTIGRWLEGVSKPERLQVLRLAVFFKVTPATILRQTDPNDFARLVGIEEARQGVEPDALEKEVIGILRGMKPEDRAAWLRLLKKE